MRYVEALNTLADSGSVGMKSLFLAGGITDCPDWQKEMVTLLSDQNLVLMNPRRANFDTSDPTATEKQIKWEFDHLRLADATLFWFPEETLCPITLLEYGKCLVQGKPLFVGVHPGYKRKDDVFFQGRHERPDMNFALNIRQLAAMVKLHKWE